MGKIYKVTTAQTPKELQAALKEAEKTGILAAPQEAIFLTIGSGCKVEVENAKKI